MSHMVYRLQAAIAVGFVSKDSRRSRVAASVGGNKAEVDFCMQWLREAA